MSSASEAFSLLECLDACKFGLLCQYADAFRDDSPQNKKNAKSALPVDLGPSKTFAKTGQDRTRRNETRRYETRQDKTKRGETRQDRTGQQKKGQDETRQDKTRQEETRL